MTRETTHWGPFGLPPGVDFATALLYGLHARLDGHDPLAMTRVTLIVSTHRMARRLVELSAQRGPGHLPKIIALDDLANATLPAGLPPKADTLTRLLDLADLVQGMLRADPSLAPPSAALDLADSLAALTDEMALEGVAPEALRTAPVDHLSAHWERSLKFLDIALDYAGRVTTGASGDARLRYAVNALIKNWADMPPTDPVIIAGSTGSRAAARDLMAATLELPAGGVVLPGFDFEQPAPVWDALHDTDGAEDHPQYRPALFLNRAGLDAAAVQNWAPDHAAPQARNALVSLALRPAPVTDQWLNEGPALGDPHPATADITLVEADHPRQEARAIALTLREAAETGTSAVLITPDRALARRVGTELDRWGIAPDDSAGRPLGLTPPGLLLSLVAQGLGQPVGPELLLALLKHPLTASGGDGRNTHLINARELELFLRKQSPAPPAVGADDLTRFAQRRKAAEPWCQWIAGLLAQHAAHAKGSLADLARAHGDLAAAWAAGPGSGATPDELWKLEAGEKARETLDAIIAAGDRDQDMTAADYRQIYARQESGVSVRDSIARHPLIRIQGTIEARIGTPDLVILGSLNEGTWPGLPAPDPWLNRSLRRSVGLLLPERRIGLAAHDFQMAMAAPKVVITRSLRSGDASTVPSRWLNRLTNLLEGLGERGALALASMTARGNAILNRERALDKPVTPVPRAARPSPRPPGSAHPDHLSATDIARLIRDPYAIYAKRVLKLRPLPALRPEADYPLRGTVIHKVMEEFTKATWNGLGPDAKALLLDIATREMAALPWASIGAMWYAKLARYADWLIDLETSLRTDGHPIKTEVSGVLDLQDIGLTIRAQADRIDLLDDGRVAIWDYKSGTTPTDKQAATFEKQLPVEIAIAAAGGFDGVAAAATGKAGYIGLSGDGKFNTINPDDFPPADVRAGLARLVAGFRTGRVGYTARQRMMKRTDGTDYDHLSRMGEWGLSDAPGRLVE